MGKIFCMHHQCDEPSQEECNAPSLEAESEGRYDSQEEMYSYDDQFEECSESLHAFKLYTS